MWASGGNLCEKIHAQKLKDFEAHADAPRTELIHTYDEGNWQSLADLQEIEKARMVQSESTGCVQ